MVGLAPVVLGCELIAAVRALRMDPDRLPTTPVRQVYDAAAAVLDEERSDRPFTDDLAAAVRLVEAGLPVVRDELVRKPAGTSHSVTDYPDGVS